MNKQKKTKLMAALSLLLTCAPCNFAKAMQEKKTIKEDENTIISITKSDEHFDEHDTNLKEKNISKKLRKKLSKKANNTFDAKLNTNIPIDKEKFMKEVENYNENQEGEKIYDYETPPNIPYPKYKLLQFQNEMGEMQKRLKRKKLLFGIGIPTGVAVLGALGFGVYKGIKKMKKNGKPQPTKNVENKGKKLVSPNVKSN